MLLLPGTNRLERTVRSSTRWPHMCIQGNLRSITFNPDSVWSPGGNRWPTGRYRTGHFNSPGWAVSRRSLPLPGGGARLPLDRRHRPSDRLEPTGRPSTRLLVRIFVSALWNPALVRRRDGANSPRKHRPALSGTGLPPAPEPAPSRGHLHGAQQGEREGGATEARRGPSPGRGRGRWRKSRGEKEQKQATAEGTEERLNCVVDREFISTDTHTHLWRNTQIHAHIHLIYTLRRTDMDGMSWDFRSSEEGRPSFH